MYNAMIRLGPVICTLLNSVLNKNLCKTPMGLIGHMSSCSMAFAMYFHVHYDYRDNEINLTIPGLFDLKKTF